MNIYAFDVDETLEISGGPVRMSSLITLRREGNVLALCGNWAAVTLYSPPSLWSDLFAFIGPVDCTKPTFLRQIKNYTRFTDYVFVGNDHAIAETTGKLYFSPNDEPLAKEAGWRFVNELQFAQGMR